VAALLDACIQVVTTVGYRKLTTTLVAERAGASVGTLYQYFPNREALMAAVLARYLDGIVTAIETRCAGLDGKTIDELASAWVDTFVDAKCGRLAIARAMHEPLADVAMERQALVKEVMGRAVIGIARNLESSVDGPRAEPLLHAGFVVQACSAVLSAAIADQKLPVNRDILRAHLQALIGGYLRERRLSE
jgi:AcrR family transcriptional regulator